MCGSACTVPRADGAVASDGECARKSRFQLHLDCESMMDEVHISLGQPVAVFHAGPLTLDLTAISAVLACRVAGGYQTREARQQTEALSFRRNA
jgi:hypothetical protein